MKRKWKKWEENVLPLSLVLFSQYEGWWELVNQNLLLCCFKLFNLWSHESWKMWKLPFSFLMLTIFEFFFCLVEVFTCFEMKLLTKCTLRQEKWKTFKLNKALQVKLKHHSTHRETLQHFYSPHSWWPKLKDSEFFFIVEYEKVLSSYSLTSNENFLIP